MFDLVHTHHIKAVLMGVREGDPHSGAHIYTTAIALSSDCAQAGVRLRRVNAWFVGVYIQARQLCDWKYYSILTQVPRATRSRGAPDPFVQGLAGVRARVPYFAL
jgi:hypothetical protein